MPFFSRVFFAIACFFRLIFDGRFATAVERTKVLPGASAERRRSNTPNDRGERHAIPPQESTTDARDTDSSAPPRVTPARDTVSDAPGSRSSDDDDDDLYSVPPVSTESHHTGLRRRSPPKPTTVPPPAEAEGQRVPPTEPSPGTTLPPSSDPDASSISEAPSVSEARTSGMVKAEEPKLSEDTVKSLPAIDVRNPPRESVSPMPTLTVDSARTEVTSEQLTTRDVAVPISEERFAPRERGALLLLALLQREGRFIDFLQQDVTEFDDEQVGAAARVVHEGCRRALKNHLEVVPIRDEAEGDKITLLEGYDVQATKLVGNVSGKPPYQGAVQHRGWRAKQLQLPNEVGAHDPSVLAQAEVEL